MTYDYTTSGQEQANQVETWRAQAEACEMEPELHLKLAGVNAEAVFFLLALWGAWFDAGHEQMQRKLRTARVERRARRERVL